MPQTVVFDGEDEAGESSVHTFTSPSTCYISGLNGGKLQILISPNTDPPQWKQLVPFGNRKPQHTIDAKGTYLIKANLATVTSTTSLSVVIETD